MSPESPPERRVSPPAQRGEAGVFPPEGEGQELIYRDDLTGLHNRRALSLLFAERWTELLAAHGEIALLILDLDLFKEVNDTWGHLTGDEVLRTVAGLLRAGFRESDLLVRYGGDEFVVALPGVGPAEARRLAERTRDTLHGERFGGTRSGSPSALTVSFSIGVASGPADGAAGEEVLQVADRRLYEEKRARQSASSGATASRWVRLGALLASLGGVLALAWLLGSPDGFRPTPLLVETAPPAERVVRGAGGGERERLAELQAEVEQLRQELALARQRGESGAVAERRRLELEDRLAQLAAREAALVGGGGDAPPAGTPEGGEQAPLAAAGDPPPVPVLVDVPESEEEASRGAVRAPPVATFSPAELLSVVRPSYPAAARRLRRTATVELRVQIDREGRVTGAEPLGPPVGYGLDQAALEAALRAVYRPARRDGAPVASEARLAVVFDLAARD